jgi:hypothetical protein
MKEYYLSVIKFPLLVSSSLFILAVAFLSTALGSYFKLGLSLTETLIYSALFIILLLLVASWILVLLSTHHPIRPKGLLYFSKWMLAHVHYYLARALGTITFQKKEKWQESFLHFNNEIVLSQARDISHKNILLLLPHCLQNSSCKIRITGDINECAECGKCDIAGIKKMAARYNVKAAVATGGSLARKLIKDHAPNVIVAVACHRDLTDGVRDAWKVPVYAVLNERPNGPCFETKVNTKTIEFAIKKFQ